jgi:hypothetical protein
VKYTTKVYPGTEGTHALLVEVPESVWPSQRALLDKSAVKHNGYLSLSVDLPHKPRSTGWKSQNHHLFGHAAQIGEELGYDRREMVYIIAGMTNGWPMAEYKGVMMPRSESVISSEVASEAIEVAHRIAAENNIRLREEG